MNSQADSAVEGPGLATTEELAAALATFPHPVFIMKAVRDEDGTVLELRYVFLNEASALLLGQPVEPLIGRGLSEVFPSVRELGIFDTYAGAIDSDKPVSFDVPTFHDNGVEGSFSLTVIRFGDGLLVAAVDTTKQRKAERELADSSRQYRLLAENASDVVVLTSPDREITWVSPSVTRTLGWEPEDLLGTSLADLIHPDDRAATDDARDEIYSGHAVAAPTGGFVIRVRTRSGDYRWMSAVATPVADESGALVGIVGGWRDVEDLVRSREAAQADRIVLRATLDSMLNPHVRCESVRDESGQIVDFRYVDANPAACAYLGMDHEDLVGTQMLDLFPGAVGAGLLAQYRQVVETGEPLVLDDFQYAQELMGGQVRHLDISAVAVGDGLSQTWRDVTDRFVAAQRLADSKEEYRLLAENASDVVMRLSPDLSFEWLSGSVAGVLGWESPELVGHPFEEFIHPEDLDRFRGAVARALRSSASVEFRFRRSDGTYQWVACRARVRVGEDGTPLAVVGGLVDIQERKAAEASELNRLEELEWFQRLTVGRELKMVELKKEIEYLRKFAPATGSDGDEPDM